MAYANGYKHDVFISFALVDDAGASDEPGWVVRFADDFSNALKARLGGTPELEIFFSQRKSQGGSYSIASFASDARESALMLSIASPSYVGDRAGAKPVSLQELDAFAGVHGAQSVDRLFLAQVLPFLESEPCPEMLRSKIPVRFWYETDAGAAITLEPTTPERREQYKARLGDLAEAMSRQLLALRRASQKPGNGGPVLGQNQPVPPTQGPAVGPGATPSLGTVLLAQVTDDLEEEREQVRRHLQQYGVRVLPEEQFYPAESEAFTKAFEADVARADMVVQLLSRLKGSRPDGHVQLQAGLAAKSGKALAQWRHPETSIDGLSDQQRALLESSTVFVSGLEAFKLDVIARLRVLLNPKPAPSKLAVSGGVLVFINADTPDISIAEGVGQTITGAGHGCSFPLLEGSQQDMREDLENNIVGCDALVLVYGATQAKWVRAQLLNYNKVKNRRQLPVRVLAIYTGEDEKPPVGMTLPELMQVNSARLPNALALLAN